MPQNPNPYASPSSAEPERQAQGLWRVDGPDLWVRHGALFKGVDLMSGEVQPEKPVTRHVAVMHSFPLWIMLVLAMVGILGTSVGYQLKSGRELPTLVVFIALVPILRFTKRWMPRAIIGFEESRRRTNQRKWLRVAAFACFVASVILPYRMAVSRPGRHGFSTQQQLLLALWPIMICLGLVFMILWMRRKPRCLSRSGSWFRLGRISPAAIEFLRARAAESPPGQATGNFLYTIDLTRFSLAEWFNAVGWKPLSCLRVVIGKLSKSPGFTILHRLRVPPSFTAEELISEPFRQRVTTLLDSLEAGAWTVLGWEHHQAPDLLGTTTDSVTLMSADGGSSLGFTESRNNRMKPVSHTILHTWLTDGKIVRTSNERSLPTMHPGVLWTRLPAASPELVVRTHFQLIAEKERETLLGGTDILDRLLLLQRENHRWFHAKGIFGPLEEEFDGNS